MVQLSIESVVPKNLFSRHYLNTRLRDMPVWTGLTDHETAFTQIKEIYDREKELLPRYDEPQLEDNFIKKVLRILGHCFEVQQTTDREGLIPDYAFFSDETARIEALNKKEKKEFYTNAIAVGDAKKWGTPLDKKHAYDIPSYQIDKYLRATDTRWAILTDGRYWRLYYRETSYRVDSYYQVDLVSLLEQRSKEQFKSFYLFFRKEAFVKDETGRNFLDRIQTESLDYAKELGDDLEENVYKSLKVLAQGFFDWKSNNMIPTPETVKEVHENCLILLYRFLFILYADSRGALKPPSSANNVYNINWIKADAIRRLKKGEISGYSSTTYDALNNLFQIIDEGSEKRGIPKNELYIPAYNGGLFHAAEHPFLAQWKVGDKYLAEVLRLLTITTSNGEEGSVDYSSLEIRHLGSIYEGLLEYKVRVAEEDLVAVKEKDKQVLVPRDKAEGKKALDTVRKGELYLVTDKGERKATGSYYTPDYIVKYIVENTLGPVAEEKLKGTKTNEERIGAILSIKVLDPAMGSGHFLVEAMNFLANKIVSLKPDIVGEENGIDWARREVVRRCIYGVDLNPLAMELAKLSLWLSTLEENKPLSFLDHHLKVGNSLIGADLASLHKFPGETGKRDGQKAISDFLDVSVKDRILGLLAMHLWMVTKKEETLEDIKEKERHYDLIEMSGSKRLLSELCNLHTAYHFSDGIEKAEYMGTLEAFRRGEEAWEKVREKDYSKRAQEIAKEKRFFHWELEFPEVFFEEAGPKSNPGFDAVIGNPPYIRVRKLKEEAPIEANYYESSGCYTCAKHVWDVYMLIMERSKELGRKGGCCGFIVPIQTLHQPNAEAFRRWLLTGSQVLNLLDLSALEVFDAAIVKTCVLVYQLRSPSSSHRVSVAVSDSKNLKSAHQTFVAQSHFQSQPGYSLKPDAIGESASITAAVDRCASPLSEWCYVTFGLRSCAKGKGQGDKSRLVTDNPTDVAAVRYLEGREINRYTTNWQKHYLRYLPDEMYSSRSPQLFETPKIVSQSMLAAKRLIATYDADNFYVEQSLVCTVPHGVVTPASGKPPLSLHFVLALMNSTLLSYYFAKKIIGDSLGGGLIHATPGSVSQLPIRRISFTTPPDRRIALVEGAKALYSQFLVSSDNKKLLGFVGTRLEAKPEESDVVHDLLAFLAERMIEMNKEKNAEIKGFLDWLEREVGTKVEDLQNKTVIKEYYDKDKSTFEDLVKALKKNRAKLSLDPGRREFQEKRLKPEYDSSTSKLRPLLERIERTDGLIDKVVYKLYDLTEEEIGVVEETK